MAIEKLKINYKAEN